MDELDFTLWVVTGMMARGIISYFQISELFSFRWWAKWPTSTWVKACCFWGFRCVDRNQSWRDGSFDSLIWFKNIWLVVWNICFFPFSWEFHHPNWRTYIFQRGRLKPPTRYSWSIFHQTKIHVGWTRVGTLRGLWLRLEASGSQNLKQNPTSLASNHHSDSVRGFQFISIAPVLIHLFGGFSMK